MYEELVKSLRETDFRDGCPCGAEHLCKLYADNNKDCVIIQAADAIEELSEVSEKAIMDYCKKRNLVLITMELFETLKAYYNRSNAL